MLRVGLLGHGAIGSQVARALDSEQVAGAKLTGVFDPWAPHPKMSVSSAQELVAGCDLVVEAAGHEALSLHGLDVRQSGVDLLVVSVGALADEQLLAQLCGSDFQGFGAAPPTVSPAVSPAASASRLPGKLYISTGAIGGLDTLLAAAQLGSFESVEMVSTKPAKNLSRSWMTEELRRSLTEGADGTAGSGGGEPTVAYSGTARQACSLFPESANVCATLALATVGFDQTQVKLVGDPGRESVRHEIKVECESGSYEFCFENRTSAQNSKTSAIVPFSVIRALRSLSGSDEVMLL